MAQFREAEELCDRMDKRSAGLAQELQMLKVQHIHKDYLHLLILYSTNYNAQGIYYIILFYNLGINLLYFFAMFQSTLFSDDLID